MTIEQNGRIVDHLAW